MKILNNTIFLLIIFAFLASCKKEKAAIVPDNGNDTIPTVNPIYAAKTYKDKAKYVYDLINKNYSVSGTDFLAENYPVESGDKKVCYLWSVSGVYTGVGMLRQLGYADPSFEKIDRSVDSYWSNKNSLPAAESYPPVYGGGTRFYDDNATIGLDYLENYYKTKNQHFLDQAEKCMAFDFTGESNDVGGGIFWNEDEKYPGATNYLKAACSSAFSAKLALDLYEITNNPEYLAFGKRLYDWMKLKLQDPNDLIIWNDVAITTGIPNKTKWTYNSGMVLSTASLLFRITGEQHYFDDAKALAEATFTFFTISSDNVGRQFPDHDPWFTAKLFRGYLSFYDIDPTKNTKYIDAMIKNVDYAWLHSRTFEGFFYEDWSGKKLGRYQWLLNQACMIEMYGRIAIYKGEK